MEFVLLQARRGDLQCLQRDLERASPVGHVPASSGARSRRPLAEEGQKKGPVGAGVDLMGDSGSGRTCQRGSSPRGRRGSGQRGG